MNIERAERLYTFLVSLEPYQIRMQATFNPGCYCKSVGCWAGWVQELFKDEVTVDGNGWVTYAARVLEIPIEEAVEMYNANWIGARSILRITKEELLVEWRRRIDYEITKKKNHIIKKNTQKVRELLNA